MSNGAAARPRAEQWRAVPFETVREFIGDDLDEHDRQFTGVASELRSIKKILLGVLLSTTCAAIALAVNLTGGIH